jgi:hypothetical protein
MGSGTAAAALVIVGLVLVVLGLFAPALPLVILGIVALGTAGVFQTLARRRS